MKFKEIIKDEVFWTGLAVFVGIPVLASYLLKPDFDVAGFLFWAIPTYIIISVVGVYILNKSS